MWFLQLDFNWMHDYKIVRLRAKYGKAILVDAVNTFILMAKCDGIADMNDPAHVDWALEHIGKKGKPLRDLFDKLAEFELISPEMWRAFGHVTSSRATKDAQQRAKEELDREKAKARTAPAREAKRRKREAESGTSSVTESVTEAVTDT